MTVCHGSCVMCSAWTWKCSPQSKEGAEQQQLKKGTCAVQKHALLKSKKMYILFFVCVCVCLVLFFFISSTVGEAVQEKKTVVLYHTHTIRCWQQQQKKHTHTHTYTRARSTRAARTKNPLTLWEKAHLSVVGRRNSNLLFFFRICSTSFSNSVTLLVSTVIFWVLFCFDVTCVVLTAYGVLHRLSFALSTRCARRRGGGRGAGGLLFSLSCCPPPVNLSPLLFLFLHFVLFVFMLLYMCMLPSNKTCQFNDA